MMITEDYVSFETAKLLKEKGFDTLTYASFTSDGDDIYGYRAVGDDIMRPTLQMTMKWLREVKHYYIQVSIQNDGTYIGYIYRTDGFPYVGYDKRHVKTTPEEACEERIKYCLENLI